MNTCDYYQELISRMLDDELSNNERSVLAEHLYMCDECAAMYSAFSMVSDMVATDLVEPPEELADDVMAHIRRAEIRKRNRRNTRATKNAIAAAACVAFVVAAVGGVAVVRNHRSDNVVYESRMSQSTAASSAKDGSYDTVIVSEAPVVQESSEQYVAPVEKYISAPQQQEEEKSFFAGILPDSWFTAATPAPTQPPVVYATPMATPIMQNVTAPRTNSAPENNMPAVVVVSPAVTEAPVITITPPPAQPHVEEYFAEPETLVPEVLPAVTEAPVAETLPVVTEAPVAEAMPFVTEAPVEEIPIATEAPVMEAPAIDLPPVGELPVMETPAVEESAPSDMTVFTDAPVVEYAAPAGVEEETLPAEQDSFTMEQPTDSAAGPVVASHDFSAADCTEFVDAIFTSVTAGETAAAQDASAGNEAEQSGYASVVDRLVALKAVELCSLPEDAEINRMESLTFCVEGQIFTLQLSFFGDEIYVQCSAGDGSPISFRTAMSPAEYDGFIALCYTFDGDM